MRHVNIKTPRKPRRHPAVQAIIYLLIFAAGVLACYLWGFWLLFQALVKACENGMLICG